MRAEKDILGEIQLEEDCLYGINTKRAKDNFDLKHKKVEKSLIKAIVVVKKAAALTHARFCRDEKTKFHAIVSACDKILSPDFPMEKWFVTEALQGGAGTSTNMNVNEVIANLALLDLHHRPGEYQYVHPLDDVNRSQSTNDVYPTALRIAAITEIRKLSDACARLQTSLQEKENEFQHIRKLGRTEWMDAVEVSLGEEFGSYAQALARDRWRIYKVEERLRQVNLGGTAVGLSNGADHKYKFGVIEELRKLTGFGLAAAEYPMDLTQNNDVFVEVSGLLKALAVNLMKIAGDFRIMNSGPKGGFGELKLAELQQGSSIMPGKVNPVIPEMVMECAMRLIANDTAITLAAAHGEMELNAFLPLIADSLLESLCLATNAVTLFREKCVETLKADETNCRRHLEDSYAFATAYISKLGYDRVSEIVHQYDVVQAKKELDNILSKMD
ncbi:MAG: aspartate ammonia-lyase [Lachnospiraceae bacterium]|nr:aspartate ammonia-lyase [Lachnospiraceae bacterium]